VVQEKRKRGRPPKAEAGLRKEKDLVADEQNVIRKSKRIQSRI
jgi:hypothetical protein